MGRMTESEISKKKKKKKILSGDVGGRPETRWLDRVEGDLRETGYRNRKRVENL